MVDSPEGIPWKRVSIEACVIVGSILLAFAIDAAWDKRLRSADESVLLESVRTDMLSNRAEIERVDGINGQAIRSYIAFIESSPTELGTLDPDSAVVLLQGLLPTATFTPFDGSLRGMDRSVLSSHEVRRTLGAWEGLVADLVENGYPLIEGARGVWLAAARVSPDILLRQSVDSVPAATLSVLRADPDFVVAMATHHRFLTNSRNKLRRLTTSTDSLLALLEATR